jgi:hypothetical protein
MGSAYYELCVIARPNPVAHPAVAGYLYRPVRDIETLLPDAAAPSAEPQGED